MDALRRRVAPGGEAHPGGSVRLIAEEQAALRRVAVLVAQGKSPEEVLAAVAAEAGQVLHAEHAFIVRYDPGDGISVAAVWPHDAAVLIPAGTRMSGGGQNLTTLVRQTGRPARLDDYASGTGAASTVARESGIRASVGAPVSIEGRLWGVIAVTSSKEPLPAGTEERLAAFTELAGIAIADAQAREELRSFAEEQAALRRVAVLVARGESPQDVLAAVAAEAAQVLHAEHAFINRYDPGGIMSVVAASSSAAALLVPVGTQVSTGGRNVTTQILQTGRPARLDDYASATGAPGTFVREAGIRATVGAPVSVEGRLWGAMVVTSSEEPLPAGTEERLASFAELAATAIANAEAQAALAASRARTVAAADAARRRIERDLHDGVQQRLISLALQLRAARAAPPEARELASWLDAVATEAIGVLEELREIARGLHPVILTDGGLRPALRALARRSAVPVRLDVPVTARLPEPTEIAAYYAVAEALTNTAKHADASIIEVQVETGKDVLHVCVRDDGRGGAHVDGGSGLAGLKDRVEALGGRLSLDSPPGTGTTLDIVLPLPPVSECEPLCRVQGEPVRLQHSQAAPAFEQDSQVSQLLASPFRFAWMAPEELAPIVFSHGDVILLGRRPDSLPGVVAFRVGNVFHLVKPRDCVPHVFRVVDGFFALPGKGEVGVGQAVLLRGSQALRCPRHVLSVSPLFLDLTSNFDVASRGFFLFLC